MHGKRSGKNRIVLLALAMLLVVSSAVWLVLRRIASSERPEETPSEPEGSTGFYGETVQPDGESLESSVPDTEAGLVVISEIMVKNRAALRSSDGSFHDWIEIRNVSGGEVDLNGWILTDGKASDGWKFGDVSIGAGEYLIVFASGENSQSGELHADFSVSAGETVSLLTARGSLSSSLTCPETDPDISVALDENGNYVISKYPTPGMANSIESFIAIQDNSSYGGKLVINEVTVANYSQLYNRTYLDYPDWIEIKNVSSNTVDLSGYYISDSSKDLKKCRLPAASLGPGQIMLVQCFDNCDVYYDGSSIYSPLRLDAENEQLFLSDGSGICDYVSLKDIPYKGSYGRLPGENGCFYFTEPTPGTENRNGFRYVCAKPETAAADGAYEGVESVEVVLSGNGDIYYTVDGSLPTRSSSLYTGPIVLESTTVLRAICSDGTGIDSRPLTLSYLINEGHTLPVLSVVADDAKELERIYRQGIKGIELYGAIEYFEDGGSFSIDCGVRMAGRASLGRPKKNLSFKFRGAYGSSRLDYDLFDGGITSFSALTLRSGHDSDKAVIRNEISEDLLLACTDRVAAQRSKWVVLYINGQYYGVFALKEKINEQFLADREGVSKESIEFEEDPTILSTEFYNTVIAYCINHKMSDPANYAHLTSILDIDSFIDWIIVEQYTGNFDILYGNTAFYRSSELDGKWKAVFFDLDAAFRYDYYNFRNFFNIDYNLNYYAQMLRSLLENTEFRDMYVSRVAELISGPLTNENVVSMMDGMYALIDSEMKRDCVRWNISYDNYLKCSKAIRSMITDSDYETHSIDTVAYWTNLTDEERAAYFGR